MLDIVFGTLRSTAETWREDAAARRRVSPHDAIADAREYDASELLAQISHLEHDTKMLSPEGYARLHGVTSQTVRNWIRQGELEATSSAKGLRIRSSAVRRRRPRNLRIAG